MSRSKVKSTGLFLMGLGAILLFILVADSVTWRYYEYSDAMEERKVKRLMLYNSTLRAQTLRHEFKDTLDFRERQVIR